MTLEGVDVSHHNGPVPWAGISPSFAFVRASYGTAPDAYARGHLSMAQGAGVELLGAYHYMRGDVDGTAQARAFLSRAAELEAQLPGAALALAVDIEHLPEPEPPWDVPTYRAVLLAFLETLRAAGRVCAVYGPRLLLADLDLPAWVSRLPLWAASTPPAPAPWTSIAIQQTGVVAKIDRNTFTGDADDWRRLFELVPLTRSEALARALGEEGVSEANVERVREYLAGCQRGGIPLPLPDGAEWCAAFACWSGLVRPKRCAVWELVEDARAAGTLREPGAYWPAPGDLAVYGRQGQTPLTRGGLGHVGRVIEARNQTVIDISGNSGDAADRVARMPRKLSTVVAWIAVPD